MSVDRVCLPNLFVVGAMRAGSTSLYHYLAGHPQVYMSRIKEPNYFSRDDGPAFMTGIRGEELARYLGGSMNEYVHGAMITEWDDYLRLFRHASDEPVVGEASPAYLYSRSAPSRIARACPEARIVAVLREPIARAYSHHRMAVAIGVTSLSFAEALGEGLDARGGLHPYVDSSLYAERVDRYLSVFGEDRVRLYLFEDLQDRSAEVLRDLASFLGIDPEGFRDPERRFNVLPEPRMRKVNALLHRSGVKRLVRGALPQPLLETGKRLFYANQDRGRIPPETFQHLREVFRPDVERLAELAGRDLSHWPAVERAGGTH